jgi:hypothetical protein
MDAFKEKVLSSTDAFQELLKKIPGYAGYQEREKRRDVDKIMRTFLSEDLRKERGKLMDAAAPLARKGKMEFVGEVDRVGKIFEKVIDRIRYADYGYAGLFDVAKINEAELEKMHAFDSALAQYLSTINESIMALEASFDSGEGISEKMRNVEKYIKELDQKFDEREKVITGVV